MEHGVLLESSTCRVLIHSVSFSLQCWFTSYAYCSHALDAEAQLNHLTHYTTDITLHLKVRIAINDLHGGTRPMLVQNLHDSSAMTHFMVDEFM